MSTTTTGSSIIHIPAKEFLHSPGSPPLRLVQPSSPQTHTRSCILRQQLAAANRAAKIHSTRLRCHRHIAHVAQVANAVRELRTHQVSERRRALRNQLARAESRRSVLRTVRNCAPFCLPESSADTPLSPSSVVCEDHTDSVEPTIPSPRLSNNTQSIANASKISKSDRLAATKLAAYYLLSRARRILRAIGLLGPALISVPFEQLANRIQANNALYASHLILRAIRFYPQAESTEQKKTVKETHCRVLLSAILIALHPDVVTSTSPKSSLLHDRYVVACARRLLTMLHIGNQVQLRVFWPTWANTFQAWKARDVKTLLTPLIEEAVALDAKQTTVGQVLTAASDTEAVRVILQGEIYNQVSGDNRTHGNDEMQWEKKVEERQKAIREAAVLVAGADGARQVDAARHSAASLRKEQLLHDILVDAESVAARMCDATAVPAEAWTAVQEELSSSPTRYDALAARLAFVSRLLNELRENSFAIRPPPPNCGLSASYACDVVRALEEACRNVQAPAFDAALREWSDNAITRLRSVDQSNLPEAITDALRDGTDFIRITHSQVVTLRIRTAANSIAEYGPSLEREWFRLRVQNGEYHNELPRTVSWLRETVATLQAQRYHVHHVLTHGLRMLVTSREPCYSRTLPEILVLDAPRILQLQQTVQKCCLVVALDGLGQEFVRGRIGNRVAEGCGREVLNLCSKKRFQNTDLEECVIVWVRKQRIILSKNEESLLRVMVKRVITEPDGALRIATARVGEAVARKCMRLLDENRRDQGAATEMDGNFPVLPCIRDDVDSVGFVMSKIAACLLSIHGEFIQTIVV